MGKVFWFDCETTGVSDNSAIIQLAGLIEIDGQVIEQINLKARPHTGAEISMEALKVNNTTPDEIETFPEPIILYKTLIDRLNLWVNKFNRSDKMVLAGYNVSFDDGFLRRLFTRCGDKYYGSYFMWPKIDVAHCVAEQCAKGLILPNYKLSTICERYGVPINAHDAMGDILATRDLYYRLKN